MQPSIRENRAKTRKKLAGDAILAAKGVAAAPFRNAAHRFTSPGESARTCGESPRGRPTDADRLGPPGCDGDRQGTRAKTLGNIATTSRKAFRSFNLSMWPMGGDSPGHTKARSVSEAWRTTCGAASLYASGWCGVPN